MVDKMETKKPGQIVSQQVPIQEFWRILTEGS